MTRAVQQFLWPDAQWGRTLRPAERVVNVASVPQRSPLRYPGGKTWLVPDIRTWLEGLPYRVEAFVEPFAGGAIASLTAIFDGLADRAVMCELDAQLAALWQLILTDADWLIDRILSFPMTSEEVKSVLERQPETLRERGFATLLANRVHRGGILARGSSRMKRGENGKGIGSRWYPETLARRIREIHARRDQITFVHGNGLDLLREYAGHPSAAFFVDPPYTAGGKKAGRRLYTHNDLDHPALFATLGEVVGGFLMTYDDAGEVLAMAHRQGFAVRRVPMKNTHHAKQYELLITPSWYRWPDRA